MEVKLARISQSRGVLENIGHEIDCGKFMAKCFDDDQFVVEID
jgi:hypothetical protein